MIMKPNLFPKKEKFFLQEQFFATKIGFKLIEQVNILLKQII